MGRSSEVVRAGRYALHAPLASGGMATVHLGRAIQGDRGVVAIKRLHPHLAADPRFATMFVDEARMAARATSPHVVPVHEVVREGGEIFLVMEYVAGESLANLAPDGARVPPAIAVALVAGVLRGLHAVHEARGEAGEPLGMVHRDVSPQNILVGTDGVARLLDFGVAKAAGRLTTTRDGALKGKLGYMPPEQLSNRPLTRQADVYSASVVLWQLLVGKPLFGGDSEGAVVTAVLQGQAKPPSRAVTSAPLDVTEALESLDAIVLKGLAKEPAARFASAAEMTAELEGSLAPASAAEVGAWVEREAGPALVKRAGLVAEVGEGREGEEAPEPRRASAAGMRWGIAAVVGVVVVGGVVGVGVRAAGTPATSGPSTATTTATEARTEAGTDAATEAAMEAGTEAGSVAATPAATATAAAVSSARRPAKARDCDPPFTWDGTGKKIYKTQCL